MFFLLVWFTICVCELNKRHENRLYTLEPQNMLVQTGQFLGQSNKAMLSVHGTDRLDVLKLSNTGEIF